MAINKVIYGGETLIDLTGDTVTADKILSGFTAHDKGHNKGENQHQRAADGDADNHHIGHLHIGNVGGQPGD